MSGDWESRSAQELEEFLRDALARVSLVGELELDPSSPLYRMALSVVKRSLGERGVNQFDSLSTRCPAALSVMLVADGIFGYEGGEYWPNIALDVTGQNESTRLGQQFEKSLDSLGLERFESARRSEVAKRYLMPILLHGKFPRYCAPDLWGLLVDGLRRGAGSTDELLSYWVRHPSVLAQVDKPVERFLRYGGELAEDLLQRMVDLIELVGDLGRTEAIEMGVPQLAEAVGINTYLVDAFFELGVETGSVRRGERLPRPRVMIDPYSGDGPSVFLPPVLQRSEGRWTIHGRHTQRQSTSRHVRREVPLRPSNEWKVLLEVDELVRERVFRGHSDQNVYFFSSETSDLVRDQHRIRGDEILALAPHDTKFLTEDGDSELPPLEELPPLGGDWSRFQLKRLDLRGLRYLIIQTLDLTSGLNEARVSVASAGTRPRVVTETVADVEEIGGSPVYDIPPVVALGCAESERHAWRLRLSTDNLDESRTLDQMTWRNDQIDLAELLPPGRLTAAELVIRGPLGSDLRTQFVVIPGLVFDHPEKLLLPDEQVTAEVRAPGLHLNGREGVTEVSFGSGTDSMELEVVDPLSGTHHQLLVSVSRLLWMVRGDTESFQSFSGEVVSVSLEEIELRAVSALSVQLRRPESVVLHLLGDGRILQSSDVAVAAGPEGRWTFPLGEYLQTAAGSELVRLEFRLDAGPFQQTVVNLAAAYLASNVTVESDVDSDDDSALCEVSWTEERTFRNREIRLWSKHRPWAPPIQSRVHDGAECRHLMVFEAPAGPYLVEVGIADDWIQPERPTGSEETVVRAELGRFMDAATHLRSLDVSSPIAVLELTVAGGARALNLDQVSLSAVFGHLCQTVAALTKSQDGLAEITGEVFPVLMEVGFRESGDFAHWLPSEGESSMSPTDLRRFVISVLPELLLFADLPEGRLLDRVWETSVVAGAAIDPPTTEASSSSDRWYRFTGWDPSTGKQLESTASPEVTLAELPQERLLRLATVLRPDQVKPLLHGGYQEAAFELLAKSWPSHEMLRRWRSAHSGRDDYRVRSSDIITAFLDGLAPELAAPAWCRFFQDLLCCALHLISGLETRSWATGALWEADALSPGLVDWALLSAIVLRSEHYAAT
jgi:hypothetical protein